ncbi:MAG: hydroxymethylglutaryl-CoA reductase, degradative, partial [Candidatus Heimdallarchaeaceae archaeon]
MNFSSRIPDFYKFSEEKRREIISSLVHLTPKELSQLQGEEIEDDVFNTLIENVIGTLPLPLGIATNFLINGKEYLIPMVVEESSVVAAASHAAKIARVKGGFSSEYSGSIVIGQIQILGIEDFQKTEAIIKEHKDELLSIANSTNKILVKLGGGAKDLEVRKVEGDIGTYSVIHLIVDTKDAMGANAVNTMLEKLQSRVEEITKGTVLLRILSNYAVKRKVKVKAVFDKELLGGEEIVDKILYAYDFANNDTYRAVTHNKGIMNGITSIMLATGNDTRAIEAGAHAYAA